jgi:hypothetical protein
LSAATPRTGFVAFTSVGTGTGLFTLSTVSGVTNVGISAQALAYGIRALYEYEGYSATVAGLYEWLMSFTSNPAAEPAAGVSDFDITNQTTGVYDPEFALALTLLVQTAAGAPESMNAAFSATSVNNDYDVAYTAVLAPVRAASGRDSRALKDALTPPRRVRASNTDGADVVAYPSLRGAMGLSMQMFGLNGAAQQTYALPINAAHAGTLYRYAPKGYPANKGLP